MSDSPVIKRVGALFDRRRKWKALWDIAYDYIAPERSVFFNADKDVNTVMDRVYDATAIDAAERLTNLVTSRLAPAWQKWFRLVPGPAIVDQAERDALRAPLSAIENLMVSALNRSNFYGELQPTILDRVVGGTGALGTTVINGARVFHNIPLSDIAIDQDEQGQPATIGRKYEVSVANLVRVYRDKLPEVWLSTVVGKDDNKYKVYELNARDAVGDWRCYKVLDSGMGAVTLSEEITTYPKIMVTLWSKIPGEPYGRGPGLRSLSDVRALNRVKELTLKHAARAVGGVYTVLDDGVINPYTLSLEPMTFIPVSSNDLNQPSIRELPPAGDLNTASFVIADLRAAIKGTFLADQFGPLDRTPMSATEVIERTRIIAQELGATVVRLQKEVLVPTLQMILQDLKDDPNVQVPDIVELDDDNFRVEFVSQLAQAQWAQEEQQLTEYATLAIQLGQVDPKAGLALDTHAALRRVGELRSIPPELMRSEQEIEELLQQAGQAAEQAQEEGVPLG